MVVQEWNVIACTGTPAKYESLEQVVRPNGEIFIPGIIGLVKFAEAGRAVEPVTSDCVDLMFGKQRNQKKLFLDKLIVDNELAIKLNGDKLLFASNDVNTTMDGVALTRSKLQKEERLNQEQYGRLILGSLRYLAMKVSGHNPGFTWKEMQKDWKLIDACISDSWRGHVFVPIDYQVVDGFSLERLSVCRKSKLESISPMVVVINQAYGGMQLDFSDGNELVERVVADYLRKNWEKPDFTPDRYPLGIRQIDLLGELLHHNQHVTFSDHQTERVIYLRHIKRERGEKEVEETLNRIENMLNGYHPDSLGVAEEHLISERGHNSIVVVNRKPGYPDVVTTRRLDELQFCHRAI